MAELYDLTTSASLTNAVESFDSKAEVKQIVNYSRDGTVYIQTTSARRITYKVECYCTTTQEGILETAWYNGDTIRITFGENNYTGVIIEYDKEKIPSVFDGQIRQDYYKLTLTLAKVTVSSS